MAPDSTSRQSWKSRFSILSFLPARHPPLHVTHPMPPRHDVPGRHQTVVSSSDFSPVPSEYPDPSTPLPMISKKRPYGDESSPTPSSASKRGLQGKSRREGKGSPKSRPPPLNLERTKMMYPPNHNDVVIDPGTAVTPLVDSIVPANSDTQPPKKRNDVDDGPAVPAMPKQLEDQKKKKEKEKKVKPVKVVDDPFDVAEVEAGHRYPSWKGGKVDLRPGQVLPREMIPSLVSRSSASTSSPKRRISKYTVSDVDTHADNYESVLHNVLLTPTYFGASPLPPLTSTPTPTSFQGESLTARYASRRRTLLDKATDGIADVARQARNSRWIPGKSILKPSAALDADQSLRAMREREAQEMARFRRTVRPVRLAVPDDERMSGPPDNKHGWSSISSSSSPVREMSGIGVHARRSPGWVGRGEYNVGFGGVGGGYEGQRARMPSGGDKGWRATKEEEERLKRRQKIWKYSIVLAIFLLAALIIGLCTTLLRKGSEKVSSSTSSSSSDSNSDSTSTSSAAAPASTSSETLTSCLNLFSNSAPNSPKSYPCADCVPLLASTTNDFAAPLTNGNSTGVGSALQFCALMDMFKKTPAPSGGMKGWGEDVSPCGGWSGITCDSRGRVTDIRIQYPDVPDEISDTVGNIYALEALRILGKTSVPAGSFPTSVLSLPNLKTIDLEYTAIRGSIDQVPISAAKGLTTLVLVNNPNLGRKMPDLSSNEALKSLAVTGQGLEDARVDKFPSGITYLDLSFNSLSGDIPTFSSLTSLSTLYLQSNSFQLAPSSLPASLASLSLTSNPNLRGSMPAEVCASMSLKECDLRDTKLEGSSKVANDPLLLSSSSSSSATAASSSSSSTDTTSSSTSTSAAMLNNSSSSSSSSTADAMSSASASPSATNAVGDAVAISSGSMINLVEREPIQGQMTCGICKFV
ncbi:hypothetical protein I316_04203 [Kwoniella heveanensis BCC8398]|uniref:Leucine-rich repeat-containing N-terminal plant-type domain-containing protein n=1 Tax=Kwoniella heveanensis BCC8398 TaxID=1296120 RepID=A0A1B9GT57_9TREE|nr:hypothetical protein I316_04203 [Kwoniella heveanensis BCC8398]